MGINKIYVARGIYWIEIPEADLRILCGCPADAVKHLIKRGLILSNEVNGVDSETGPNAILLSDLPLQNGNFTNLAEFPVLQMLYKQGMMLPGHPNNTGRKPLIMGSSEQVESQLRYIYRGNYGLVSREEITQAGASSDQAAEMMRLKLKFAFGRIQPTGDFLDSAIIEEDAIEIAVGVILRRLQPNVFEFQYQDKTVTVDLNLRPGETYECPYQLGYRRFQPEYFAVIHSGEGDGWDCYRPCMASIITYQNRIYLIDAGPNIGESMVALGISIDQIDGIFHTHSHDDHFAGLTTLMRSGHRIRYFATPLVRASVVKKFAALMGLLEKHFANFFDICDLELDKWNDVEGLEVMPVFSPHPVETNFFVFRTWWEESYRTYAHFADIVSMDVLKGMITDQHDAPGLDQQAFETTRLAYMVPVDLKKIDVGGGLIHGEAKDFRDDKSTRILLAHRTGDNTPKEKEIGSSAAFGTVDVLIAGQSDVMRHHAFNYLQSHLPGVPIHDLRMLVNHPITEINPGFIILKESDKPQEVLLLVSGLVEKIRNRDNVLCSLSAGSLIGIGNTLHNRPSRYTYRTSSFVQVMRLPVGLYSRVLERNGLLERMRYASNLRDFLETTNLFNEGLPSTTLMHIIDSVSEKRFLPGETIGHEDLRVLNIIRSGLIERWVGDKVFDFLKDCDFFGEEGAIFNVPYLSHLRVQEETTVIQIPGELLENVPILRWKLLESYQQRVKQVIYNGDPTQVIVWRNSFSIQVADMDNHHKRLIEIANAILDQLHIATNFDSLAMSFEALVSFSQYHFTAEEKLMDIYNYPGTDTHSKKHSDLFIQLAEYKEQVLGGNLPDKASFMSFFNSWLVSHVFDEDCKYGAFLNDKGVY